MKNRKLICQMLICCFIMGAAVIGSEIEHETFAKYYRGAKRLVMQQLTAEDLKSAGVQAVSAVFRTPSKLVSAAVRANAQSQYGAPIDEKSDSDVKQVHAACGGMVIASGKDKEIGLYVKIKHEEAVSVYGNLSDIGVIESERVQRGEIIGNYDPAAGKEFYYELQEDL